MYSGTWRTLPECVFVDWPDYAGETSISALAKKVVSAEKITRHSILAGSSLGGIVACEIANQLPLAGLILIGSATNKTEVNPLLATLHPLIDLAPLSFIQQAAGKVSGELGQMFRQSNPDFIRAMTRAIFNWDGLVTAPPKLLRLHGKHDHVILPPPDTDHLIDGGHLIAMTHPAECTALIAEFIRAAH